MAKNVRSQNGQASVDPSSIDLNEYNNYSGAKKVTDVGRNLIPLAYANSGTINYTTDASTARQLNGMGLCLAVYNNSGTVGSITLGQGSAPTSLGPGVTNAGGQVGIACAPNSWTYIACGANNWVISSASTLLVYQINDDSYIQSVS